MAAELHQSRSGQTLVLTIANLEHRNALGPEIYAAGLSALSMASTDAGIRSIVITGAGGVFSAGGNLQRLQANRTQAPEVQGQSIEGLHQWIKSIAHCPKPVIAAVEGAAAGAGFSLALACDLLVTADDAVMVMAYSSVALSPDGGGTWSLAQALPRQLVTELLMCGNRISTRRLQELGVVNQVGPSGTALQMAMALAETLNGRAPNAMASAKTLTRQAYAQDLNQQLDQERDHFVNNLHHANAGIGITAFLNKTTPRYL
jgi:enoyl-CoA hydratase/carnithine racemase